jgi:hypothetical protein
MLSNETDGKQFIDNLSGSCSAQSSPTSVSAAVPAIAEPAPGVANSSSTK